jgi:hypothetical protein
MRLAGAAFPAHFAPRTHPMAIHFEVVKPSPAHGSDYRRIAWAEGPA